MGGKRCGDLGLSIIFVYPDLRREPLALLLTLAPADAVELEVARDRSGCNG